MEAKRHFAIGFLGQPVKKTFKTIMYLKRTDI